MIGDLYQKIVRFFLNQNYFIFMHCIRLTMVCDYNNYNYLSPTNFLCLAILALAILAGSC